MNAIISRARALALEAGIDADTVAGEPVEVVGMHDTTCVVWGLTWAEVSATEDNGVPWFDAHPEVQVAPDVFTWEDLARYSVWVDGVPEGYAM